ncbi:MAG: choice-of-anchor D domain-containing protein, partial [bacterium]|nr:choice-of-anchor D domain-containing protein [bacterium]
STPPSGTAIPLTTTVGTPIDTTIAVNETGTAPLTVNVALSNTTDFTLTSPATFNIADGGAAQNIVVRCNATTETGSPFTTTVTVTTNDPTQPAGGYTYPITCTVTPVTGTPGYGSNPTNGTAIPLTTTVGTPINATIAVTETGNAPLTVNVALSNTTDFTLTSPATFTINDGGAAQNIVVRCNATTNTGSPFTTTVTVTTNDPTQPAGGYTYPITCTVNPGAGTSGYASTPNPSATIPLVTVVATPVNAVINVTETGTAPLTVNVALSNAANFTLVSPTSFTIADGGAAQDIIVRCNAVQAGSYTTTITATTNDPAQPAAGFQYTVTCRVGQNSGRFYDSVPPPNTVLPTVNTTINVNGTTTVTIFNAGTEALTISAITWTNNPVFTVTPAAPFTLTAPNSSQILTITCRSATPGTFQSVVSVTHDGQNPAPEAPTVTYTVNCNVSSLGTPGYSSAPAPGSTINFGSALVGTTITTSLVVSETGGATLQVTQPAQPITGTNAADFAIISGGPPFSIPDGGQNRIITLRCIPLALGTRTALLTFTTNDPARTSVSYTLVCNGVNVLPTPTPVVTTQPPISVVVTQVAAGPTPVTGVVVQVRGLSGRSGPYLGASLLRVARPNNTYPILGRSSDESSQYTWYLIQIGTRQVWVSGRYFQVSGDPFSLPEIRTVFDEIDDVPDTGVAVITRAFADLRRRPSPRSQILQELPPGTQMALLGRTTQNGGNWWYHVRLGEVEGWIPAYAIVRGGNVNDVPLR